MSTQPVVVTAYFFPVEGKRGVVLEALERTIPQVHEEAGCNLYAIHEAPDGSLVMIEHWDSEEELDAHGAGAPVAAQQEAFVGALTRPVEVTRLKPLPIGDPAKGALGA